MRLLPQGGECPCRVFGPAAHVQDVRRGRLLLFCRSALLPLAPTAAAGELLPLPAFGLKTHNVSRVPNSCCSRFPDAAPPRPSALQVHLPALQVAAADPAGARAGDGPAHAGQTNHRRRRSPAAAGGQPAAAAPGGGCPAGSIWASDRGGSGGGRRAPPASPTGEQADCRAQGAAEKVNGCLAAQGSG